MGSDHGPSQGTLISEGELLFLTGQIVRSCLLAGLARPDAEDVAQDIWAWLVKSDNLAMVTLAPWVSAVIANFVRRFLRRRWKATSVFVTPRNPPTDSSAPGTTEPNAAEARLFLERLAARSPAGERKLLELLNAGYRLSEAARRAGIVHGSEQFHIKRIRERARRLGRPGGDRSA